MLSMASNMMLADERVLWMAQREAMACSRIVSCLQKIAGYRLATAQAFSLVSPRCLRYLSKMVLPLLLSDTPTPSSVSPPQTSPNIALEAHAVRAADWNGMTCMLFQRPSPERTHGQDRQLTFKCNATSSFSSILVKVRSSDAL